jgi:hypothetical protein
LCTLLSRKQCIRVCGACFIAYRCSICWFWLHGRDWRSSRTHARRATGVHFNNRTDQGDAASVEFDKAAGGFEGQFAACFQYDFLATGKVDFLTCVDQLAVADFDVLVVADDEVVVGFDFALAIRVGGAVFFGFEFAVAFVADADFWSCSMFSSQSRWAWM